MVEIEDKSECCGCGACRNICPKQAINLKSDDEGFMYPFVNVDLCIKCGLCIKSCPIIQRKNNILKKSPLNVYAGHAKDEQVWHSSSSGGAFQVLASNLIDKGGIVYGAIFDENFRVIHARISNQKNLEKLKGSKYVQSNTDDIYPIVKKDLKFGYHVLFSGTPCQIEGLIQYLHEPYDNLITCDILCHSVPSPKVFKDYTQFLQEKYHSKIISINMKDKTLGWGHQSLRIRFENGREIFNNRDSNLWNTFFYSRLISRPCCYSCRFASTDRPGDITVGDFWGIERSHPELVNKKGVSLIFVNTEKGLNLFNQVSDKMVLQECLLEDSIQDSLKHPIRSNPLRDSFWKDYQFLSFREIVSKYFYGRQRKSILSLIKRIYKKISQG